MTSYIVRADLARGDLSRTYRDEVPDGAVRIIGDTLDLILQGHPAEAPGRPGYWCKGANVGRTLIVTLYAGRPPEADPMLTVAVCLRSRDSGKAWAMMHKDQGGLLTVGDAPPATPWLAERVEALAVAHMAAMRWSGSWARCVAWAWMEYDR